MYRNSTIRFQQLVPYHVINSGCSVLGRLKLDKCEPSMLAYIYAATN